MKEGYKFMLLVALALTLVVGYGLLPDDSRLVELLHVRQMALSDFVNKPQEETMADKMAAAEAEQPKKVIDLTVPDTTKVVRALFIGDSMVGRLSISMANILNANGQHLSSVSWASSTTQTWAECDTLDYFIRKYEPTIVLICLGSNELFTRDLDFRDKMVKKILAKCGDLPVIWFGPPNWAEDNGINEVIRKNMGDRAYYPSYKLTLDRIKDKRHPTQGASDVWADSIADWINRQESIYPTHLVKPTERNVKQDLVYLAPPGSAKAKAEKEAEAKKKGDASLNGDKAKLHNGDASLNGDGAKLLNGKNAEKQELKSETATDSI